MDEQNIRFLIGIFNDIHGAESALKSLEVSKKQENLQIEGAVAVQKDKQGNVSTYKTGLTPGKGTLGGVLLGGAIGILTGGLGLVLGALGGVLGNLMGKKRSGAKYTENQLYHILTTLSPGTSAVLVVTNLENVDSIEDSLLNMGAEVILAEVPEDLANRLHQYHEEAYSALEE